MIVESAVLIVTNHQHRLVPYRALQQQVVDLCDELLRFTNIGRGVIVVRYIQLDILVGFDPTDTGQRSFSCMRAKLMEIFYCPSMN